MELWLTSEDLGAYGRDIGVTLPELLWQLVDVIPDGCMLRLGMTNPPYIMEHLEVGGEGRGGEGEREEWRSSVYKISSCVCIGDGSHFAAPSRLLLPACAGPVWVGCSPL